MKKSGFETPILLLAFNRPDLVERQLTRLSSMGCKNLYVAVDGPRVGNRIDEEAATSIKSLVATRFPYRVKTLFRTQNEGCKLAVSRAITWFFSQVEQGIIIEDDCLVDESFFPFACEMLDRYASDTRIWHVGAANFVPQFTSKQSYVFSLFPHCWGWATWKRAWEKYDVNMTDWPTQRERVLSLLPEAAARKYWEGLFTKMYERKIDTWDYQWVYTIWKHRGLSIVPGVNLVTNVGFDARATHTKLSFSPLARHKAGALSFPLVHPAEVETNKQVDIAIQATLGEHKAKKILKGIFRNLKEAYGLVP